MCITMRFRRLQRVGAIVVLGLTVGRAAACGTYFDPQSVPRLIAESISTDESVSRPAIVTLRALGQPAVDAMCDQHDRHVSGAAPASRETIDRLRRSIDAVAKQRDAWASRLFWHTDFDLAKASAQSSSKPILSLRLLGNLDDDLSCANSRFFRSVLYANKDVSNYLCDHFVLHWESVRPVPRISIDFGDGRRIERTITGNSIHYVLDSGGTLIDAVPGLYGPSAFVRALKNAENVAIQHAAATSEQTRTNLLIAYHGVARRDIEKNWRDDLAKLGIAALPAEVKAVNAPLAVEAAPIAMSKMAVEAPMLKTVAIPLGGARSLESLTTDQTWERLSELHLADAQLDDRSIALIREKSGPDVVPVVSAKAIKAQTIAVGKRRAEDPFFVMLQNLRESIAADTVRNEYVIHRQIHEWLADGSRIVEIKPFNERVYAKLFLTPLDDPWMGLAPATTYAALDRAGVGRVN